MYKLMDKLPDVVSKQYNKYWLNENQVKYFINANTFYNIFGCINESYTLLLEGKQ